MIKFGEMNRLIKQRIILASGVSLMIGVVGYVAVYLPFYSDEMKLRKEQHFQQQQLLNQQQQQNRREGGSRGSMWKNLDAEIKK